MQRPYLIAELGVNFYDTAKAMQISPMEAAKLYVEKAKEAGCDAVKFQSYKANTIVSKNSPAYWDTTKEPTKTQYELFLKHDHFGEEDYKELAAYCKEVGVDFLSTPFDYASADFLDPLMDAYKISSSDLSNFPFLEYIAKKGKPVYLSVGATYEYEIFKAVHVLQEAGCEDLTLLHCVLSYPTKNEDANLNMILRMGELFPNLRIGYSDHTLPDPTMTILTTAAIFGAEVIEKHFTLDKTLPGNDHYHAGDPEDFARAVENFKLLEVIGGEYERNVLDCEQTPRREARRSLVLTRDMKAGEVVQESDLMPKRPGTGISPEHMGIVVGRAINKDLEEDHILTWGDL